MIMTNSSSIIFNRESSEKCAMRPNIAYLIETRLNKYVTNTIPVL